MADGPIAGARRVQVIEADNGEAALAALRGGVAGSRHPARLAAAALTVLAHSLDRAFPLPLSQRRVHHLARLAGADILWRVLNRRRGLVPPPPPVGIRRAGAHLRSTRQSWGPALCR